MRLRHIEVFNAVMLTGSVSAAARMINVTQPAVSRTLQHAELQLGFALFQRERGRLKPTVEAQTLYPLIERLFSQLDEVQRLSASLQAGRGKGELRVLTVLALSYEVFPRAMQLFRAKYPGVVVHTRRCIRPRSSPRWSCRKPMWAMSSARHPTPPCRRSALRSARWCAPCPRGC